MTAAVTDASVKCWASVTTDILPESFSHGAHTYTEVEFSSDPVYEEVVDSIAVSRVDANLGCLIPAPGLKLLVGVTFEQVRHLA